MKKILALITAIFTFCVLADELSIPGQCGLYADDSDFSCCIVTYRVKRNIYFELYARHISMVEDLSDVEDFLGIYYSFDKWPLYAESSENISYDKPAGGNTTDFSLDMDTLHHKVSYTITAHMGRLSVPITIKESSIYKKRKHPAPGAIASYDFFLNPESTSKGLKDKKGQIHVTKDKDRENLLLYLKFLIDPGVVANITPRLVIRSIENSFEDLLKGMMNVDYGCKRFSKEDISSSQ